MLRGVRVAVAVVALVAVATSGVGAASTNQAPFPAAGLDQSVDEGATVYLDAGGSYDPDGEITAYEWTITAPNGTTLRPRCGSCVLTRFTPERAGTYEVRVTVTDDDGASRSDMLYVTVAAAAPPTVQVSGPTSIEEGSTAAFEARVQAGDHALSELVWTANGTVLARQPLDGDTVTRDLNHTFTETGQATLRVRALDRIGEVGVARHVASVTADSGTTPPPAPTGGGPNGGYTPTIHRPSDLSSDSRAYQLLLDDGVVRYGGGDGIVFDKQAVDKLLRQKGVSKTKHGNWVSGGDFDTAVVITNERIKDQLDKEVNLDGFRDANAGSVNPDADYDPTKWSVTSPGLRANWKRVDKRLQKTETTDNRQNKEGYKLVSTKTVRTGQTYVAKNKRNPADVRVGSGTTTTTQWFDSRWATARGDVVNKRVTGYTWQERHSHTYTKEVRQRTGRRPVYGTRQVTKEVTEWQCVRYDSLAGTRLCMEHGKTTTTKTVTESYLKGYEPVYNTYTKTVTETEWQTRSGQHPPAGALDVQPNYEYEVAVQTQVPKWGVINKKYNYKVYKYKWKYDA